MKAVWTVILVLLLVHVLALLGFVGWLAGSGRLNQDHIKAAVSIFELTVDQQKQRQAEAEKLAEQAREAAEKAAQLEAVSDGPRTLAERLTSEAQLESLAMHRIERLQRETEDLRRQISIAKQLLAKQKSQLESERQTFEQYIAEQTARQRDADFQQTVQMYEQLKPKQVKQMFQDLLTAGQTDQVVEYLAAMQMRKAGKVLQEFKSEPEIAQATMLLEKLRQRGIYMTDAQDDQAKGQT